MGVTSVNPYLIFPGTAEEAFNFYRSVFGGEFNVLLRFRDFPDDMGARPDERDKIAHIALPLGERHMLMATDALESRGRPLTIGDNSFILVDVESVAEAERLFAGLSDGGRIELPLQLVDWAERHGQCVDRHGITWMVSVGGRPASEPV